MSRCAGRHFEAKRALREQPSCSRLTDTLAAISRRVFGAARLLRIQPLPAHVDGSGGAFASLQRTHMPEFCVSWSAACTASERKLTFHEAVLRVKRTIRTGPFGQPKGPNLSICGTQDGARRLLPVLFLRSPRFPFFARYLSSVSTLYASAFACAMIAKPACTRIECLISLDISSAISASRIRLSAAAVFRLCVLRFEIL